MLIRYAVGWYRERDGSHMASQIDLLTTSQRQKLSQEEQQLLALVEEQRGKAFVRANWRLILEQAKALGELPG